jgi:hypothetical protein
MEPDQVEPTPESKPDAVSQPEIAKRTIAFWQPRTSRRLAAEDAREIMENLTGFFRVLAEWDKRDRQSVNGQYPPKLD